LIRSAAAAQPSDDNPRLIHLEPSILEVDTLDEQVGSGSLSAMDCTERDLAQTRIGAYLRRWAKKMKIDIRHWPSVLREAERELDAATTRTALNAAAMDRRTVERPVWPLPKCVSRSRFMRLSSALPT
jgi:hypothetical protein